MSDTTGDSSLAAVFRQRCAKDDLDGVQRLIDMYAILPEHIDGFLEGERVAQAYKSEKVLKYFKEYREFAASLNKK